MQMMRHMFTVHQEVAVSSMRAINSSRGARNRMLLCTVLVSLPFPTARMLKSVRPSVRMKELENFRMYYHDILHRGV